MLGSPETLREARAAIYHQFLKDEISEADAVARLRDLEPASPLAAVMLASSLYAAGDLDRAEEELWTAVAGAPNIPGGWFRLAAVYEQRSEDSRAALAFRLLALWQLALSDEIPNEVVEMFPKLGDSARSPSAYAALAEVAETALGDYPWPERLRPYRLLRDLQRDADAGLDPDTLRDILDHYDACVPIFRAALRQWSDDDGRSLSDEAASLLLAILGERGRPDLLDDIFPDEQYPTTEVLTHAQWAVRRIGQQHPAETFARLQAFAAAADVTARSLLAEQFYFLPPEIEGRRQAVLALLDDSFPDPDDAEESAYLLLTVSTVLAMLGAPADSRAVVEKHRRRLPAEARRLLQETLDAEEPFVPDLCARGVDALTLEQVAFDLALAPAEEDGDDDLEDYEDDDLDYDDDYVEPAVAESRPGRNDPCWCGSGKKYKKCHLESDDDERRAAASTGFALYRKVVNDILETAIKKMSRSDVAAAHRLFFDCDPGMSEPDEDASAAYLQWMTLDYRGASGRTGVEEYLRRRGRLPEDERAIVDALRDARFALWEIQRIEKGRGVEVKDYFGDERLFINDVTTSKESAQWDCLIAYFFQREGRWEFFSDAIGVPRMHLPRIAERVEAGARETQQPPSAYFRSRSHEWRRFLQQAYSEWRDNLQLTNTAGDPLEFSSARYEALDPAAAESALLASSLFAAETPGQIVWLEAGEDEGRRVFGHIALADGSLTLECNSRKRLAVGRQLVEKHAGEFLRHLADEYKPVEPGKIGAAPPPPPDALSPETEREIVLTAKAVHYAGWPDEPLPALGGRTPRDAVRSETGRRAVEDLLRDFENGEDRQRRSGRPAFDFGPIRKELGLD